MTQSRCFLYSSDCPTGKIFTGDDAIAAAVKDGWKDAPVKPVASKKAPAKKTSGGKKKAAQGDDST